MPLKLWRGIKEIGFWTLSIVRIFNKLNTRRFGDWICLRPQVKRGEETPILLGPLERANLNLWTRSPEAYLLDSTTNVRTLQNLSRELVGPQNRSGQLREDAFIDRTGMQTPTHLSSSPQPIDIPAELKRRKRKDHL
jgi:hypothetical protein